MMRGIRGVAQRSTCSMLWDTLSAATLTLDVVEVTVSVTDSRSSTGKLLLLHPVPGNPRRAWGAWGVYGVYLRLHGAH